MEEAGKLDANTGSTISSTPGKVKQAKQINIYISMFMFVYLYICEFVEKKMGRGKAQYECVVSFTRFLKTRILLPFSDRINNNSSFLFPSP